MYINIYKYVYMLFLKASPVTDLSIYALIIYSFQSSSLRPNLYTMLPNRMKTFCKSNATPRLVSFLSIKITYNFVFTCFFFFCFGLPLFMKSSTITQTAAIIDANPMTKPIRSHILAILAPDSEVLSSEI